MERTWFHHQRILHYDLTAAPRRLAVSCGAVEVDLRQAVDLWARIQGGSSEFPIEELPCGED